MTAGKMPARVMMAAACISSVGGLVILLANPLGSYLTFGWTRGQALFWDAGLSFLFFAQHSIMVRRFFRIGLRIPEHYWGSVYATASGVALAIVALFWQRTGEELLAFSDGLRIAAMVGSIVALLFFAWGMLSLRGIDPIGVAALRAYIRGLKPKPASFVLRGPYKLVRHPLYFAVLVLIWLEPHLTIDRLLFNVLWTVWIVLATHLEEADLVREMGDQYRDYQKHVPMLIPWRLPSGAFRS